MELRPVPHRGAAGVERVELAEHLGRQIAEQGADLDAGDPGADADQRRVRVLIRSAAFAFSGARTCRKPSMFAWIQRGRSTTSTGAVPLRRVRPVTCCDVLLGADARVPQVGHGRGGALTGDLRTGLDQLLAVLSATVQSTIASSSSCAERMTRSAPERRCQSDTSCVADSGRPAALARRRHRARRQPWQPQRATAAVTRSSQIFAAYSPFGLLVMNAYTSREPSVVRTKPASE